VTRRVFEETSQYEDQMPGRFFIELSIRYLHISQVPCTLKVLDVTNGPSLFELNCWACTMEVVVTAIAMNKNVFSVCIKMVLKEINN